MFVNGAEKLNPPLSTCAQYQQNFFLRARMLKGTFSSPCQMSSENEIFICILFSFVVFYSALDYRKKNDPPILCSFIYMWKWIEL